MSARDVRNSIVTQGLAMEALLLCGHRNPHFAAIVELLYSTFKSAYPDGLGLDSP